MTIGKVCNKCKRELPLTKECFEKRTESKDGFRGTCKECKGGNFTIRKEVRIGFKKCSKCSREFPATSEYFNADRYRPNGLTTQCIECRYKKKVFGIEKERISEGDKICIDCKSKLSLDVENFLSNAQSKDGYSRVCIQCLIKRRHEDCEEGFKKCKKCGRELSISTNFFIQEKRCLDGFRNVCLECTGRKFYPEEKHSSWSDEDLTFLKECFIEENKDELLRRLPNRTWKAIRSRANKMGLKKRDDYIDIPANELYIKKDCITYKRCKKCQRYLPLELLYFPKDDKCKDAYRGICKECKGEKFAVSNRDEWTKEEEDLFIELYPDITNKRLMEEHFNDRTIEQLSEKAYSLRIHRGIDLYKTEETNARMAVEKFTEECRRKISETKKKMKCYKGKNNPMYGSRRVGELNPNWKGGKRNEKETFMASVECKDWRKKVFGRDNYTCQCCGSNKSGTLEAHHIESFAYNKESRVDVENGITLCKECHNPNQYGGFHNLYGTLNNNREQLMEYFERYRNGELKRVRKDIVFHVVDKK